MEIGLIFKSERQPVLLAPINMPTYHNRLSQFMVLLGDFVLLNLAFLGAAYQRFRDLPFLDTEYYNHYLQLWLIFNLLWLVLSLIFKTYQFALKPEPRQSVSRTLNVLFSHLFIVLLLLVALQMSEIYSRLFFIYFYSAVFLSLVPWHFFYLRFLRSFRRRAKPLRSVLLVGEGRAYDDFVKLVGRSPELGIAITRGFKLSEEEEFEVFAEHLNTTESEELFVALNPGHALFARIYRLADQHLMHFRALPDLGMAPMKSMQIDFYDQVPVLSFRPEPLQQWHNRLLKRWSDILIACLMLILLLPTLFPIITLGVLFSGRGPLLFKQKRSGYRGEEFTIYKFRTMAINAAADQKQAFLNDPRITKIGFFLRKWHLDELPQLFQVANGTMSLVGPRPHMLLHTEQYRDLVDSYMLRHLVKPGLTGMAQVQGFKGEHDLASMEARVQADVYYLENWSLVLDLTILLRTLARWSA
jgi:putative colanic acid biosynthesis UDP-glucose lipid carrier transferase